MKNKNYWILVSSVVISGWLFWFFSWQSFVGNANSIWTLPAIFFIVHSILLVFLTLIEEKKRLFLAIFFLANFPVLIVGVKGFGAVLVALILALLLILSFFQQAKAEIESRIKINIYRLGILILGTLVLAFSLLVSAVFFGFAQSGDYQKKPMFNFEISPKLINLSLNLSKNILSDKESQKGIDSIIEGVTVDEYLSSMAKKQIETEIESNPTLGLELKNNPSLLEKMTIEAIDSQKKSLAKQLGIEISGTEQVKDLVAVFINSKINEALKLSDDNQTETSLQSPFFLTLGFFLLVLSIGYFLRFFIKFLLPCFFWLMKKAGFFKVLVEKKDVEIISV